jgi:hypothetical protein
MPSPVLRVPSVGHLGALWNMRQSEPSFAVTPPSPTFASPLRRSAPSLGCQDSVRGSWRRPDLIGIAESDHSCHMFQSRRLTPSRQRDVRSRRIRRPADFGASLGTSQSRSHSCLGQNERRCEGNLLHPVDATDSAVNFSGSSSSSSSSAIHRGISTPPTGTAKADGAAASTAKAVAVAALQRLFFEEMAKNGQDANGAAARALLRLSETPPVPSASPPFQPDSSAQARHQSQPSKASHQRASDEDEDAPCVEEEVPARRPPVEDIAAPVNEAVVSPIGAPRRPLAEEGRRRRPCMHSHVRVQS